MTPMIDIVFLLIVFFVVVCHFIEAENFGVNVPDDCDLARSGDEDRPGMVTLIVTESRNGQARFTVGPATFEGSGRTSLVNDIVAAIDSQLDTTKADDKVLMLRIDRTVPYSQAQYALAAAAQSRAQHLRIAALTEQDESLP